MDCPTDGRARMGLYQLWLLLPYTVPASLLPSDTPSMPHTTPHMHTAYLWHNAIKTPVLQAAKQPSHYLRHFELKPQKYNYGLRATGASGPGQVLGSTNTASSLQRRVIWRGVDAYIRIAPWGRSFSSVDSILNKFFFLFLLHII